MKRISSQCLPDNDAVYLCLSALGLGEQVVEECGPDVQTVVETIVGRLSQTKQKTGGRPLSDSKFCFILCSNSNNVFLFVNS